MDEVESLPAAATPERVRSVMRRRAASVSLVTTLHDGRPHGLAATSLCSLSFDPLSLLVCINRAASAHAALLAADRFSVSILHEDQADVARSFGDGSRRHERFRVGAWTYGSGLPVLADAQASLLCRRRSVTSYGTHDIMIGEIDRAAFRADVGPLIYLDGRFHDRAGTAR